jgi:hypothetical protein
MPCHFPMPNVSSTSLSPTSRDAVAKSPHTCWKGMAVRAATTSSSWAGATAAHSRHQRHRYRQQPPFAEQVGFPVLVSFPTLVKSPNQARGDSGAIGTSSTSSLSYHQFIHAYLISYRSHVHFHSDVNFDPFTYLRENNKTYGLFLLCPAHQSLS